MENVDDTLVKALKLLKRARHEIRQGNEAMARAAMADAFHLIRSIIG